MTESVPEAMAIEVIYALADRYWNAYVRLPAGARVADALLAAGTGWLPEPYRAASGNPVGMAIFGRPATPQTLLHHGDRIELLRPLQADPKLARRKRAADARRDKR